MVSPKVVAPSLSEKPAPFPFERKLGGKNKTNEAPDLFLENGRCSHRATYRYLAGPI